MIKNTLNRDSFRAVSSPEQLSSVLQEFTTRLYNIIDEIISDVNKIQTGSGVSGRVLRTGNFTNLTQPATPYQYPSSLSHPQLQNLEFSVSGHVGFHPEMLDIMGGLTGQILSKTTDADYDFTWVSMSTVDHSTLANLGFAASGHTGFQSALGYTPLNQTNVAGGTTNQVLAKTSVIDYDFKWMTISAFTSPLTTKGDIHIFSTVDTRLPVGTTGQILVSDSVATPGVKWDDASIRHVGTGNIFSKDGGNLTLSGIYNVGIGYGACIALTTGAGNLGFGYNALSKTTTGALNTALGFESLWNLTTGSYNFSLGSNALNSCSTGTGNIGIGVDALFTVTGSYNIGIGMYAGNHAVTDYELYIDVIDRGTTAGGKAGALLYGGFNSTVKDQFLHVNGVFYPLQATTAACPTYVLGGMYFDTTLNKLRIGGATGWETVTSV